MEVSTPTIGMLEVEYRSAIGSQSVRKLRQAGRVPGICYGKNEAPVPISFNAKALVGALDPEKRSNTLITLTLLGRAQQPEQLTVMLRDWQKDALRDDILHADFLRVSLDEAVHAVVPIVLTGKSEGVKLGGTLHQVYRTLAVSSTPDKIPTRIEVAIDTLGMGDALHVSDLKLPEGVRPLLDAGATICTVTAPKAEKAAAAAEGEAAAAAAAPAAAAPAPAGKAAPAAGAKAAAPAAKGPEKKK